MGTDTVIRITGGHVIDPAARKSAVGDVWAVNGRITDGPQPVDTAHAEVVTIDASGCHVFPGLADFHLHMFHGGTEIGLQPDAALLPQGVTLAVDQGSAGVANCDAFYSGTLAKTTVRGYAFLHLCPAGLVTTRYLENIDPANFDPVAVRDVFDRYPGTFLGLKIRQSIEIAGSLGLKPLERAIRIADDIGVPVVVHTTDPAGSIEDLASMLRPGDVFSHVFHGRGETIFNENGDLRPAVRTARERGVFFDTADGRVHYGLKQIRHALTQGFLPDTISTDLTRISMFMPPVFGLPFVMSKYLALGMHLEDIVRAVTHTPVKILGLDTAKLGTLQPGAYADIAICKVKDAAVTVTDKAGDTVMMRTILSPQITVRNGKIVYRNIEFCTH
ncbi:MAG: Deacetylase [Desulfovibrio sp.]